jgi:hypothetical protein
LVAVSKLTPQEHGWPQEQWGNLIVTGIRNKIQNGMKIFKIAEECGLCEATISKLYYGETKFPRHSTIVKIMVYLGYHLYAI